MVHRFASFELDEEKRELRIRGRDVAIQPKVFDLLVYLIRNQDRVVGKEELLNRLWPDVIVTDGSLQRAVSLARSALRKAGTGRAIRTYSREGYRFCVDLLKGADSPPGDVVPVAGSTDALRAAREAHEAGSWEVSLAAFAAADRQSALQAQDLERWGHAAQCAGRPADAIPPLERAVAAYGVRGDRPCAARSALALVRIHFEHMDTAVAKGWHRRATALLASEAESSAHGHLHWLGSRFDLVEGRIDEALAGAERATEIGRRLADSDVEALGLLYQALALLARGTLRAGAALLDEAAAAVLAGQVSPLVGGLVYCGVLWGCRNVCDWDRAAQWTENFNRWCERHRLSAFPGVCRLHRAEVLGVQGQLVEAEKEIRGASEEIATHAPWAEGDAHRVLGDLLLARGDLEGAESAFRRAHELGWDPQPGHALLQVARGLPDAAVRALRRALADRGWYNAQRRGLLLAHLVIVATAAGESAVAREAIEELDARPDLWRTPALEAVVLRARAEVARAEGRTDEAVVLLRRALALWQKIGSPLNAAGERVRLARLLREVGESLAFDMELSAAEHVFRKLDAPELVRGCEALRKPTCPGDGDDRQRPRRSGA